MYRRASAAKSPVATPSPPRTTRRSARSGGAPSLSPARATRRLFLTILALSATLGAGVATAAFARPHLARARAVEAASIEASRALPHAVSAVGVSYDAGKEAGSGPLDPATHLVGTLFYPTPHASGVGRPPRSPRWSTWHYTRGYLAFGSRRGGGVGVGGRLVEGVSATFFNTLLATVRLPVAGVALSPSPGPHLPVIFSHGLGGTRHAYSALCAGLAGRGFVVLSLEHADATAAVAKLAGDRGWLPYASWAGDAGTFARSAHRQVELDTAARVLEALASPGGAASLPGLCLEDLGGRPSPPPSLLSGTLARAPHIRPAVVGHSFGGAAAVQAAATGKWSAAVAVDPWYGALPADAPPFTTGLASPLLVLASHQWSIPNANTGELSCGKARQDALFQAAAGKGAGLVHAVVGQTLHVDFGDVAALVGAAYPALAAKASKKAMALQTGRLGLANDNGGSGLGTADAVAVVRLTARATADWLAKFMRLEGGMVGQGEGSALMGAAAKEEVQLFAHLPPVLPDGPPSVLAWPRPGCRLKIQCARCSSMLSKSASAPCLHGLAAAAQQAPPPVRALTWGLVSGGARENPRQPLSARAPASSSSSSPRAPAWTAFAATAALALAAAPATALAAAAAAPTAAGDTPALSSPDYLAEAMRFRGLAGIECLEAYAATDEQGGGASALSPPQPHQRAPSVAASLAAPQPSARARALAACLVTPAFPEEENPGAELRAAVQRLNAAAELEATLEYAAETAGAAAPGGGLLSTTARAGSSSAARLASARTAPVLGGGGGGGPGGRGGPRPGPTPLTPPARRARRWAALAAEDGLPADAVAALEAVLAAAAAAAAGPPARSPSAPRASAETIAAVAPVFGGGVPLLPPPGACKHTLSFGGSLDDSDFEAEQLWCPLPPGVVAPPPADWPEEEAWLGAAASGGAVELASRT